MDARYGLFLALIVCVTACNADTTPAESKKAPVDNNAFIRYVPQGWILQDHRIVDIDIDRDGFKDAILTLLEDEHLQKGDLPYPQNDERAVLVLLGDKNGKYRLSSFAKNAILCASCAGMMGSFGSREPGIILFADKVFSVGWISGSRDTVGVELNYGFDAKLGKFVLLSDRVDKTDRVEGKSIITKRDFVAGTKTVDGKVSKMGKKVIPIESVKYYDYLGYK